MKWLMLISFTLLVNTQSITEAAPVIVIERTTFSLPLGKVVEPLDSLSNKLKNLGSELDNL